MSKANGRPHGWTTPVQLRQQVQRLWDRGELLKGILDELLVSDQSLDFPLRLRLKKPTSRDIGDRFSEVRAWIQSLSNLRHTRLELLETRHPQLGKNDIPQSLWIDSLDDAIAFLGKREECRQFSVLVVDLMAHDIKLIEWVRKRPLKVLELASVWQRLLKVHQRIVHEQDNVMYLRQLSVAGVDTKFIETHRGILTEWLDMTLPASSIDTDHRGSRGFVRRYGFKDKPLRLRLRSLDSAQPLLTCVGKHASDTGVAVATADLTLDADVIKLLDPPHSRVIITENEINYLVLPDSEGTLAVFGSGYGLQSLAEIKWLQQRDVWYWGDIDTHGFAILSELRGALPDVRSMLMDRQTLMAHEALWGCESKPANRNLEYLSDEEAELYRDLVEGRYGYGVRLEQEQIDYEFMLQRLTRVATQN